MVCVTGAEWFREDASRLNVHLWHELRLLQDECKRLKAAIAQLGGDYERSKHLDVCRRYNALKGMIKRCVLQHTLLTGPGSGNRGGSLVLVSETKEREETKRLEQRISGTCQYVAVVRVTVL